MNDKQMLELAAKAGANAGLPIIQTDAGAQILESTSGECETYRLWNTLDSKSDCFDLMVALKIEFYIADSEGFASYAGYPYANGTIRYASEWHDDSSPETATRRAITRAAAEIGRAL